MHVKVQFLYMYKKTMLCALYIQIMHIQWNAAECNENINPFDSRSL